MEVLEQWPDISSIVELSVSQTIGRENIFIRTEKMGEAGIQPWDAGHKWLAEQEQLENSEEVTQEALAETTE